MDMADEKQVALLLMSVAQWNQWREKYRNVRPDLSGADLGEANLSEANLSWANLLQVNLGRADLSWVNLSGSNLHRATLSEAYLLRANLRRADLSQANLIQANLGGANLRAANLSGATLLQADLYQTDLSGANLSGADLELAQLVQTNLQGANLSECRIYGTAVWDVRLDEATVQTNLRISPIGQQAIVVDNLKVAQFLYLMLHNEEIRSVIDTIAKKLVLILGRFTPERLVVLDAMRDELRRRNYLPVVFDFEQPNSRDLTETVSTLAHMARFVIADLTDARSIPQELSVIIPNLPSVAIQPLIQADNAEFAMFAHWQRYPSVLDVYRYEHLEALLVHLKEQVIDPAEQRANEITPQRAQNKPF